MENNRSLSVDITKDTAIIAIVLGHIASAILRAVWFIAV